MPYTTSQGYEFRIADEIVILEIPKTKGEFSVDVQAAKREICLNKELPHWKEIILIKTGYFDL